MPYKAKLKSPASKPRKKATYKVTNWSEYNQSLKNRGKVTLYFPPGDLKAQFVNEETYIPGVSGQQVTYTRPYVEILYTFYRLFGWGLRQITGYFEDLWETSTLDIEVPSFGHLSDLFSSLPLKVKHFCDKITKRLSRGESVELILDSTGMRFSNASHWYETKYGKARKNKPWRKLHLSMDSDMEMYGAEVTDCDQSDLEIMGELLESADTWVDKVTADGGYYSIEGVEALSQKGIIPAIPPPSHSVVHNRPTTTWHDKVVQYIQDKGTIYAFHKKYGYAKRSLVEAQISRIKRCIGSSLKTQKTDSQKREGIIIANIINKWNSFGRCISEKVA